MITSFQRIHCTNQLSISRQPQRGPGCESRFWSGWNNDRTSLGVGYHSSGAHCTGSVRSTYHYLSAPYPYRKGWATTQKFSI